MTDLNFDVSDADLYGILAENMDDVIDKWVNENPEAEAAAYNEELPIDDENEPEAPNTWYPGNPTNITNIPFTGTPSLVSPHNMDGKSCIDFFIFFFNVNFWNLIVECTNKCGNKLKTEANTSRARFAKWKDLTISELKVFIGIILFMGTIKLNRMADYCSIYFPSKNIAIDESLILWKGPDMHGIKLYILADMHGIILKIHLYQNHVKKVVNLLMEQYINKGHSLYIDNFYTSVGFAEELLNKNTYVTGTLRAKRRILYNAQSKKIVVTKWLDKREVLLLSSEHDSYYKMTTSRRIRSVKYKPAAQVEYNKYKHDQLLSYYSCEHKTLRWYKKVIIHVIQTCLVNGYLLYRKINNSNIELYYFRKVILENLLQLPNVPVPARYLNERIHLPTPLPKHSGTISRKRFLYGCPGFPGLCLTPCFREYHNY
ncbi:hypothetical protein ABMA28_003318 [Loxostege sticticalis]|uniref:PiggyBac transposable element-derived protein domain-containing protein n=1 Tax=Loxostege sticticalis TaxID=481309 RepID=A0ABD0SVW7_LOXSC